MGPILFISGVLMLELIKINFSNNISHLKNIQEKLAKRGGYLGSFLLGSTFALAFCPFSAVLFFGILVPLAIKTKDSILIPTSFAFATGLPVIILSLILVNSVSKLGKTMNKIQTIEKIMRKIMAIIFIIAGAYLIAICL